ncbi:MAG: hypothetical protein QHJ82_03440, partial [Verrucomicrobiota bacterium]|nr:hypothetical protein [Verrucomicrobiota bacterium]
AWQKHLRITSSDVWTCSIDYPIWPWQKGRCRWGSGEVRFPPQWPECGEWAPRESGLVCELPKNQRELLVGVLIWKKTLDSLSLWQTW